MLLVRRILLITLAAAAPNAAAAQSMDTLQLANDLGTILGSEEPCGFSYDQSAISAWIDQKTDPADMSFTSMLSAMTGGAAYGFADMSASAKTAHCRSVERNAKHYGFMQ